MKTTFFDRQVVESKTKDGLYLSKQTGNVYLVNWKTGTAVLVHSKIKGSTLGRRCSSGIGTVPVTYEKAPCSVSTKEPV